MNINSFILDYDFDGDIKKMLLSIRNGDAISYNDMPFPIENAYVQGEQLVLPLWHKNIIINLTDVIAKIKEKSIVKITININK